MTAGTHGVGSAAASNIMDLEELAETVSETLWLLQLDQLQQVGAETKIPSCTVATRRALIRLITESMDSVIDNEEQDVATRHPRTLMK